MKNLPKLEPMALLEQAAPFDDPDWLFEVKYDGFRSLAYIENDEPQGVNYKRIPDLRDALPDEINAKDASLDVELVVLDGSQVRRSSTN